MWSVLLILIEARTSSVLDELQLLQSFLEDQQEGYSFFSLAGDEEAKASLDLG